MESVFFGNMFLTEKDKQLSAKEESTFKVPFQDLKRKNNDHRTVCDDEGSVSIEFSKATYCSPTKKIKLSETVTEKQMYIGMIYHFLLHTILKMARDKKKIFLREKSLS